MSYCVNCGVELADSEKFCPLCQTEVINPRIPWKDPEVRPYPPVMETLMQRIDRRYLAALISTFLLVPVIVVLILDWLNGTLDWSLYVVGAAALLEIWFIVPLTSKRYRYMVFLAMDCIAGLLYLLVIENICGGTWFLPLALPIGAAASVMLLASAFFFQRGRGREFLIRLIFILCSIGVQTMVVELATDMFVNGELYLNWSPFVLTPCIILAAGLLIIENKQSLKAEIHKRIFY